MYFEIGLAIAVVIGAASILLGVMALTTHFVFRPLLLELVERTRGRGAAGRALEPRLAGLEAELLEMGEELRRLREARDFDRQLAEEGREEI